MTLSWADEKAVYADRAYEQKQRRRKLKSLGIKDRIHASQPQEPARLAALATPAPTA